MFSFSYLTRSTIAFLIDFFITFQSAARWPTGKRTSVPTPPSTCSGCARKTRVDPTRPTSRPCPTSSSREWDPWGTMLKPDPTHPLTSEDQCLRPWTWVNHPNPSVSNYDNWTFALPSSPQTSGDPDTRPGLCTEGQLSTSAELLWICQHGRLTSIPPPSGLPAGRSAQILLQGRALQIQVRILSELWIR